MKVKYHWGVGLFPFFTYYGSKYRIAPKYPFPTHKTLIEPFAGSAGYSLHYPHLDVILYDLNPKVCGVWDYLIKVSESELAALPSIVNHVDDVKACQEAKWLIGFCLNLASTKPCHTPSKWMKQNPHWVCYWGDNCKALLASQLSKIRHWKIHNQSYVNCPDSISTWFVDPPYNCHSGRIYPYHDIDYTHLSNWCEERKGRLIVCEMEGATWLPFKPFFSSQSLPGKKGMNRSNELIYTKDTHKEY